jgi:hypothetical protein
MHGVELGSIGAEQADTGKPAQRSRSSLRPIECEHKIADIVDCQQSTFAFRMMALAPDM